MVIVKLTVTGVKAPLPTEVAVRTHDPFPIAFKRFPAITQGPVIWKSVGAPEFARELNT